MRVLVCGDRAWEDPGPIERELRKLPVDAAVIHGGCRGADSLAGLVALQLGLRVRVFPALWREFGRAVGPIRNQEMIDEGRPDCALVFHADLLRSRGTVDMVRRLAAAGVPYEHFTC